MSDDNVSSIDHDILTDFKPKQSLLDLKKNPLLISILEGCDTLKQMMTENKIPPGSLSTAKGLLLMKTDKVSFGSLGRQLFPTFQIPAPLLGAMDCF